MGRKKSQGLSVTRGLAKTLDEAKKQGSAPLSPLDIETIEQNQKCYEPKTRSYINIPINEIRKAVQRGNKKL